MILQRLGMPIYLQVKSYILEKIKAGEYKPGNKLPTERELAQELGISRNTVSAAYKELLLEGTLEARQGRGTFLRIQNEENSSVGEPEISGSKRERVLRVIDSAMAKAVELGFTLDQFAAIVSIRAQEKIIAVRAMRVAIVGCTEEYIRRYIAQVGQTANVSFEAVSLHDLTEGKIASELLRVCDLVVVPSEHYAAVVNLIGNSAKVINIATVPNLEALLKLARLPAGTAVGVVASSPEFVETLNCLLTKTMITGLEVEVIFETDAEELRKFVSRNTVLVVAEDRQNQVRQLIGEDGKDIIPFYYEIDQGSLNQLLARLIAPIV